MRLRSYINNMRKEGRRSFTIKEMIEEFQISPSNARVALHRLMKTGDLISPARGLYVIVPPEDQPYGSIPAQDLVPLIMRYVGANYYVALLSAGLFHGATHQKPAAFQVISDKEMKSPLIFGSVEIDFFYKKSFLGLPIQDFVVSTGYLKVATPELIVLDLLSYPKPSGGLNHIATVFSELAERINSRKLIELAKGTGCEYQLQRIGYILERIDVMNEKVVKHIIDALASWLEKNKPKKYLPLASEISKKDYPRCSRWKIIENTSIESDL